MTIPLCSKPGFAQRAQGFETLKEACLEASLPPMTRIELDRAVAQGTSELSAGARSLLMFYVSHLSMSDVQSEQTAVFPGTERATSCLGISPATLRRHKVELERQGYLIRRYDHRNRPLECGAIDLRPLLVQVPAILKRLSDDRLASRDAWQERRQADEPSAMIPQAVTLEPLNNPKKYPENSLPTGLKEEGQATLTRPIEQPCTGDADRELIAQVLATSPTLRAALPAGFSSDDPHPTTQLRAALPTLFPHESHPSIGHTGLWAEQRLGAAMFAAVAIAVEDPEVRRPAAYFGRLVTKAERYDPSENLKRLADLNPPPVLLEGHDDPASQVILETLAKAIGISTASSWFGGDRVRFEVEDGTLMVITKTLFLKTRIEERFAEQLTEAARTQGAGNLLIATRQQMRDGREPA